MVLKRYYKALGLGLVLLSAVGCKVFEGKVEATEQLTFNARKNNVLAAGTYDSKLQLKSRTEAELEVSVAGNNNNPKVIFKIPQNDILPDYNGPFDLTAAQSGQPYDVKGNLRTRITDSPVRSGTETCTVRERVYRCWRVEGRQRCGHTYEDRIGNRCIRYFDRYMDQEIVFKLLSPNTSTGVGEFEGRNTTSESIVVWRDRYCHRYSNSCY